LLKLLSIKHNKNSATKIIICKTKTDFTVL